MPFILLLLALFFSFSAAAQPVGGDDPLARQLEQGVGLLNRSEIDSAGRIFADIIPRAAKENKLKIQAQAISNLGRIAADKGNNTKALEYYLQALGITEKLDDKRSTAAIQKNIGALYISWKKFEKALAYYDQAEQTARSINDEELVADCWNNKGTVYEQQLAYDKAVDAYKRALEVYTRLNKTDKISMALSNVAIIYKSQKNYKEALRYNFMAVELSTRLNDKWMMAATNNNIGNLYGEMGDYKNAILYCNKALALAKEIDAKEIVEATYDSMAEAAAKAGDYKMAFEYHKLFSQALDQFINTENTKQLSELNIRYETTKKEALIQQQQFEIARRNYWLLGSLLLLVLLLFIAWFVYRNIRFRQQKRMRELAHEQQEVAGRALFEGEQNERIRIARDLHDSIGQHLSVIKMKLGSLPEHQLLKEATGHLDTTITEVRTISHNLMPEALNFSLRAALEDLCETASSPQGMEVTLQHGNLLEQYALTKQQELSIYRIVQEIIANTLKHAKATEMWVSITGDGAQLRIETKENGIGFNADLIHHATGIGWKNIQARVNLLQGNLHIVSHKNQGTQIVIDIPATLQHD